jgi:hypothetical protein
MQKIRMSILALIVLAFVASSAQAGNQPAACRADEPAATISFQPEPVLMSTGWVFWGCWERYQIGPCKDIFQDSSGGFWICANCGQTTNPSPSTCSATNTQALDRGFWCS